jgi:hypothetical protein
VDNWWETWGSAVAAVIALAALVLGIVNAVRTWRYRPHWTMEDGTGPEQFVKIWNRTGEDAVDVNVTRLYKLDASPVDWSLRFLGMVEKDAEVDLTGVEGTFAGQPRDPNYEFAVAWTRARTRVQYRQVFRRRDPRSTFARARDGWKQGVGAFRRPPVSGRRVR